MSTVYPKEQSIKATEEKICDGKMLDKDHSSQKKNTFGGATFQIQFKYMGTINAPRNDEYSHVPARDVK